MFLQTLPMDKRNSRTLILSNSQILACLRTCLSKTKLEVRKPAVACILELAQTDTKRARIEMGSAGITSTLRHMCDWPGAISFSPGGRTGGLHVSGEEDKDVINQARQALDWLENDETGLDV
jgi:hypothetical protein